MENGKLWKKNDTMNDTSQFKKQRKKNGLHSILNSIKQIFHETMDKFQLVVNNIK